MWHQPKEEYGSQEGSLLSHLISHPGTQTSHRPSFHLVHQSESRDLSLWQTGRHVVFSEDLGHPCGWATGSKRRLTVGWCVSLFPHHHNQVPEKKLLKRGEHLFGSQFERIPSTMVGKTWRQTCVARVCGRCMKSLRHISCQEAEKSMWNWSWAPKLKAQPPVGRLLQEVPLLTNSAGALKQCHLTGPSIQTHELCVGEGFTPKLWQVATGLPCSPLFPQDCSLPLLGSLPCRTASCRHPFLLH